jgi:hypothetical protein
MNPFPSFSYFHKVYLEPLSYGIPSALGARDFLEVNAKMIIEAIKGIML